MRNVLLSGSAMHNTSVLYKLLCNIKYFSFVVSVKILYMNKYCNCIVVLKNIIVINLYFFYSEIH